MWSDNFVGIPFKPDGRDFAGCDCYGLLRLVYRMELGIALPDLIVGQASTTARLRQVSAMMEAERKRWLPVDRPEPFDAIILQTGRFLWHVGVVIDRCSMLHTDIGHDSAVEEYTGLQWRKRIDGFVRYAV